MKQELLVEAFLQLDFLFSCILDDNWVSIHKIKCYVVNSLR